MVGSWRTNHSPWGGITRNSISHPGGCKTTDGPVGRWSKNGEPCIARQHGLLSSCTALPLKSVQDVDGTFLERDINQKYIHSRGVCVCVSVYLIICTYIYIYISIQQRFSEVPSDLQWFIFWVLHMRYPKEAWFFTSSRNTRPLWGGSSWVPITSNH